MALRVLVTGAGGFIGHHLVKRLVDDGHFVRGVDIKEPEFEATSAHEFQVLDLRSASECRVAVRGMDEVYHLAADMGGIGYITGSHASIARNNTLINLGMLEASRAANVGRFLFSSSACVYPQHKQGTVDVGGLREEDAWPADPEPGYGLEKLYMEKLCAYYQQDFGLETRVVRFHNVYGPLGTYQGGKEKAPAAISRKIAQAPDGGVIAVWGDGLQTRSFMYIDDCVEGLVRLMRSTHSEPLNLGTEEMVSINDLVDLVAAIAGKKILKRHDTTRPQGVRGRNSENTLLRKVLGWQPSTTLAEGLVTTYRWIEHQVRLDPGPTHGASTSTSDAIPAFGD